MIGNDIVDLHLASVQSNWQRRGWLQKIFTESEQQLILEAKNPDNMVWKLWSMKEATYKAHQRCFPFPPKYNPKDFISSVDDTMFVGSHLYKTSSKITKDYIHTMAYTSHCNYKFMISKNDSYTSTKEPLKKYISLHYKIPTSCIEIIKDTYRIPFVKIDGKISKIKLSYSSHGVFSSFMIHL